MSASQTLMRDFRGVSLSFTKMGVRKTLSDGQKEEVASHFHADADHLSAGKALFNKDDVTYKLYKRVTKVFAQSRAFWREISLPFTEPGIRLIKEGSVEPFDMMMHAKVAELRAAVEAWVSARDQVVEAARAKLGDLFNEYDYPDADRMRGMFDIRWGFPSLTPPDYLMELKPALYEQEMNRVRAQFDEAARLAEEAFAAEFRKLLGDITERLSGERDGQAKEFKPGHLNRVRDFFEKFSNLNVGGNAELEGLIEQARTTVEGLPFDRGVLTNPFERHNFAEQFGQISNALGELIVDRPRRRIMRETPAE